jgi:hypothetical protein
MEPVPSKTIERGVPGESLTPPEERSNPALAPYRRVRIAGRLACSPEVWEDQFAHPRNVGPDRSPACLEREPKHFGNALSRRVRIEVEIWAERQSLEPGYGCAWVENRPAQKLGRRASERLIIGVFHLSSNAIKQDFGHIAVVPGEKQN